MKQLIAVIGAGGKTTALTALAEGSGVKTVLLTTTTHIFPMGKTLTDPTGAQLAEALSKPGILCAGSGAREGKLGMLPPAVLAAGIQAAGLTVYEADGAHYYPLKLHRPGEPVILPGTTRCLVVAGLSGLGRPAREAVHRYDRDPLWKEEPAAPVGAAGLVRCVLEAVEASGMPGAAIRILLNQADVLEDPAPARQACEALRALGFDARVGSLREDGAFLWDWVVTEAGCP